LRVACPAFVAIQRAVSREPPNSSTPNC
jgi:hypothetical protein